MPVNPLDKPIAKLREETIDQLTLNYSHGEISLEAFERRLDQALDAETNEALLPLTADLDLEVDAAFMEEKKRQFGFMTDAGGVTTEPKILSIFGRTLRQGSWNVPEKMRVVNSFADTILDFDEAKFTSMTIRIKITSVFGGIKIYIPEGINVVTNVSCIMAGVNDNASGGDNANKPTIILDGFIFCSDIKIKSKKTFRKKLLEFAETIKAAFA